MSDPLTSELPRVLRSAEHYKLRRSRFTETLAIWFDYIDPDDGTKRSQFQREISHAEDFLTHVDDLEEEMRYLVAEARAEFS